MFPVHGTNEPGTSPKHISCIACHLQRLTTNRWKQNTSHTSLPILVPLPYLTPTLCFWTSLLPKSRKIWHLLYLYMQMFWLLWARPGSKSGSFSGDENLDPVFLRTWKVKNASEIVGKYSLHGAYGWLFENGDEQLPSYIVGIKISHDITIIVWPIRIVWFVARKCVFQHCWIDRWFLYRMGVSVVWAMMRTFTLMIFFQTKLDLDGWVIGACYGTVMKTSEFLFPEITLAAHKNKLWTLNVQIIWKI